MTQVTRYTVLTVPELVNIHGAVPYSKGNRAQKSLIGIASEGVSLSVFDEAGAFDVAHHPQ